MAAAVPTPGVVTRTLALIKPDATAKAWREDLLTRVPPPESEDGEDAPPAEDAWETSASERSADKSGEILMRISKEGFHVVARRMMHLSKAEAEAFYAEHAGKPFFETLTIFMSSGPIIALVLEKVDAVAEWRKLMGPTNSIKAREAAEAAFPLDEDKWPIRALFGTDGTRNATHGSDSAYAAWRESNFFFPELDPDVWSRSVAIVLPHALASTGGSADAVIAALEAADFCVSGRSKVGKLPPGIVAALLGEAAGDAAAVEAFAEGESEALLVERKGAVKHLRLLAGPVHSVAINTAPSSLHARFGVDDAHAGVVVATATAAVDAAVAALFSAPLQVEATLAVIKPGTADTHYRAILADIHGAGFSVLAETRRSLTRDEAELFYREHRGRPFFAGLTEYMSSGPVVALALAKPSAIRAWRLLQGPTNTTLAKRDRPDSLRARFGVDGTRNATHGSDSAAAAARELRFYFPDLPLPTSSATIGGAPAVSYLKGVVVADVFDSGKGYSVPRTLDAVVVEGLAELARSKPSSNPAEAIRWLGQWLVDHNPRRGVVQTPGATAAAKQPIVMEPADEDADASKATAAVVRKSRALARGAPRAAASPAPAPAAAPAGPRTIVFVLGAPGGGKGTQCARLSAAFGYAHLSSGDLLREEVAAGTPLGQELDAIMSSGALVSTELVLRLLRGAMERSGNTKFLIDGFPRAADQAVAFEKEIGQPSFVISFEADEATLEARLVARGLTSGRADDNVESIRKRFATFRAQSEPVIDFYAKLGCVRRINSMRSVEAVFAETATHFNPRCVWIMGGPGSGRKTVLASAAAAAAAGGSGVGVGLAAFTPLSVPALLRAEAARDTEAGATLTAAAKRGDPVPVEVTLSVVRAAMDAVNPVGSFIIEGCPVDKAAAIAWEAAFGPPAFVVHLDAPDKVLLARAAAAALASGKRTKEEAAGLSERQLASFKANVQPVLALYSAQALVRVIDASQPLPAVTAAVKRAFAPALYFVLGGPGSGKGTQCALVVRDFGFTHLSTGDLLRAEAERGSPQGAAIAADIASGLIVPVDVTLNLLKRAMANARDCTRFLIDGFPRALDQATAFARDIGDPTAVVYFDCPESTMRERLLAAGRVDDNEASIDNRLNTFREISMPVIDAFAPRGKVRLVDAAAPPINVFASVRAIFNPTAVFVLGLPGSGKGTQCERICKEFGYTHLSTGDILRAEVARGSAMGVALAATMAEGALVSDDIILGLLRAAMVNAGVTSSKFLIDGFPRSTSQAEALEFLIGKPAFVLHFDVPKETVRARLLARGESSGRSDDNDASIDKRFRTFDEQSRPVITLYEKQRLVRTVSGLPPPASVYSRVRPLFQPQFCVLLGTVGAGRGELATRAGRVLGYHTLRVSKLLAAEAASGSADGRAIAAALSARRTAPLEPTLSVLARAVAASGASRFLLDGYPRVVSAGYPGVHDQVFALEERLGGIKGAVVLEAGMEARVARSRAVAPGEVATVREAVDCARREKGPVAAFFTKVGKACTIDTTELECDAVFEAATPFLQ